MKNDFTKAAIEAPDLLNTTIKAKETDRIAFDLGLGDGADLLSAGLQAKSNAAENILNEKRQRQEKDKAVQTVLELALLNPEYRKQYEAVWHKIDDTQAALDAAILENVDNIRALEEKAMQTDDGRMIFQTDDGFVYANGSPVSEGDEPSLSNARKDATRWEDYKAATDRREQLARIQTETLDPIRERMSNPDNPPSKPELDDFEKRLEDVAKTIDGYTQHKPDEPDVSSQVTGLALNLPQPL